MRKTRVSGEMLADVDEYLEALVARNRFSGSILVAQDGEPVAIKGYGLANREHGVPNTPQTKFRLGSVTKQFTAMAILILQEQNKLHVYDRISKLLPECPSHWEPVTIHHLLTHTSGIPEHAHKIDWTTAGRSPHTVDQIIELFRDQPLVFEPGEQYRYSNSGYALLGKIIEQISGVTYETFLDKHIFEPLGMVNTGYDSHDRVIVHRATGYDLRDDEFAISQYIDMSIPYAAGALYSTVEDLLLWDQALYANNLVSTESLETMFMINPLITNYGYGMEAGEQFGRRWFGHGGSIWGFLSHFIRYPEDKLCIAVLSNLTSTKPVEISRTLAAIVFNESYDIPVVPTPAKVEPSLLRSYEGTYQFAPEITLTIQVDDDRLIGTTKGGARRTFHPQSETQFFHRSTDDKISFYTDQAGNVTHLILNQQKVEVRADRTG